MAKVRTAKQKAALRKAQLASARKRKGSGKGKAVAKKGGRKRRGGPSIGSRIKTAGRVAAVLAPVAAGIGIEYLKYKDTKKKHKQAHDMKHGMTNARNSAMRNMHSNIQSRRAREAQMRRHGADAWAHVSGSRKGLQTKRWKKRR